MNQHNMAHTNDVVSQHARDIFALKPNNLGNPFLTAWYKRLTKRLKAMPFLYIIPLSLVTALLLYLVFGGLVVRIATILQYGF